MEGKPWIRPAAVAGRFYPGDADALRREVGALLTAAGSAPAPAVAVMAPHAGYIYSGGVAGRVFAAVEVPERVIVLHFPDPQARRSVLSWAYILDPVDEGTTRLIFRFKLDVDPRPLWGLIYVLLIEIPHFVMERKMMLGIKERVEPAK